LVALPWHPATSSKKTERLTMNIIGYSLEAGEAAMPNEQIERIPCPTRAQFEREIRPLDRPFVFTGAIDGWRAKREWTMDYFRDLFGDTKVVAEEGRLFECTKVDDRGNLRGSHRLHTTLRDFIDRIERGEVLYITEWVVFDELPVLYEDIDLQTPGLWDPMVAVTPKIYIGPSSTFTPIHFDYAPNLTAHVRGRKRWVAYARDQTHLLYRYPWPGRFSHFSRVNSFEKLADLDEFPLMRETRPVECVVEEGEAIYMPERWWHHVQSLDPAVSVHFFWKPWPLFARQLLVDPIDKLLRRTHASRLEPQLVAGRLLDRIMGRSPRASRYSTPGSAARQPRV
jgi:lysine-specific demethylase 8